MTSTGWLLCCNADARRCRKHKGTQRLGCPVALIVKPLLCMWCSFLIEKQTKNHGHLIPTAWLLLLLLLLLVRLSIRCNTSQDVWLQKFTHNILLQLKHAQQQQAWLKYNSNLLANNTSTVHSSNCLQMRTNDRNCSLIFPDCLYINNMVLSSTVKR